jgi:hypothetical protein
LEKEDTELSGLVHLPMDSYKTDRLINGAKALAYHRKATCFHSLSERLLLDSSVILLLETVSLLSLRLLRDITGGYQILATATIAAWGPW